MPVVPGNASTKKSKQWSNEKRYESEVGIASEGEDSSVGESREETGEGTSPCARSDFASEKASDKRNETEEETSRKRSKGNGEGSQSPCANARKDSPPEDE